MSCQVVSSPPLHVPLLTFITNEHWFTVVLCICHIDRLYQCGWLASYTLICFLPGKFTNWHFFLTSLQTDWWLNHGYFLLPLLMCRHCCCLQSVIANDAVVDCMRPLGLVRKSFLVSLQKQFSPFVSITLDRFRCGLGWNTTLCLISEPACSKVWHNSSMFSSIVNER